MRPIKAVRQLASSSSTVAPFFLPFFPVKIADVRVALPSSLNGMQIAALRSPPPSEN